MFDPKIIIIGNHKNKYGGIRICLLGLKKKCSNIYNDNYKNKKNK